MNIESTRYMCNNTKFLKKELSGITLNILQKQLGIKLQYIQIKIGRLKYFI